MTRRAKEPTPQHRLTELTWSDDTDARRRLEHTEFCALCKKLSLHDEAEARSYLGLLIRRKRQHDYVMTPYRCPHGKGWHVGHNYAAIRVLKGGKR